MGTQFPLIGAQPPIFGRCLLWPNSWMHQDSTWYGGRPRAKRYCLIWTLLSPKTGTRPNFRLMSIVAKRLDGSSQDATSYDGRPRPTPHCVKRGLSPPKKGVQQPPPLFGPCLLWPSSPISATAELLLTITTLFTLSGKTIR